MKRLAVATLSIALAACLQIGGSAPPPAQVTGEGEVPFTLAGAGGAAIVVPVQINGTGPHQFVVDTGATLTCLDHALVQELELPEARGITGYGATVGGSGAMGLHRVNTLAVGDTSASGLTVCAIDLNQMQQVGLDAAGLLGLNFLKSFTVTFDFKRQVLSLTP